MNRRTSPYNPDRFLLLRGGLYSYNRRVPSKVAHLDSRAPTVRISLSTEDLAQARAQRDRLEKADNEFWAALLTGADGEASLGVLRAAQARAQALGFTYRYASEILAEEPGERIADRLRALVETRPGSLDASAVVGTIPAPKVVLTEAFKTYVNEIVADELIGKSRNQRRGWMKVKERAVTNFVSVVSDKAIEDITRDDARVFYNFWRERVAPAKGKGTHSSNSGNRDIGNMRVICEAYMKFLGVEGYRNPFDGLSFSDKVKRSRPPFSVRWLEKKILAKGAMETLNDEARGIVLAMIETGCRPSELCNLQPEQIILSGPVPYLDIRPIVDHARRREIKTASSARQIPLVGVALEVFKKHPKGFPRYRDREDNLSAALNAYFKENKLFETPEHKIYSIRHSFEDRMKVAGLDTELRMIIMGHSNERPKYGQGGTMEWRREELLKIILPFDANII